ncbi:hypothetical protein [Undibacterium sp. WLX3042]|uniref:hypothetical protein n=1 Tax=Undibacterium sp. WLX3042 TaxID=3412686 RepID=UPI003C30733E
MPILKYSQKNELSDIAIWKQIKMDFGSIIRREIDDDGIYLEEQCINNKISDKYPVLPSSPILSLATIHLFVKECINNEITKFPIQKNQNPPEISHIKDLNYFSNIFLNLWLNYPTDLFPSAEILLAKKVFLKPQYYYQELTNEHKISISNPEKNQADIVNDFIDEIKNSIKQPEFKRNQRKQISAARKNFDGASEYINRLLLIHSSLKIVRLECGIPDQDDFKKTGDIAKIFLKKFTNNRRNNGLFHEMLGGLWKLEAYPDRGAYFHFMVFFHANTQLNSDEIARQIGNYWVHRITNSKGSYRLCSKSNNPYISSSIGIVKSNDKQSCLDLCHALYYLTFKDRYLKIGDFENGRRFGKWKLTEI